MGKILATAVTAILSASVVLGQTGNGIKCSPSQACPKDTPCCSQYGECGLGAYCLGGCDGKSSFSLDSCVPSPVCKSGTYKLDTLDGIVDQKDYLGDPSKADWVSSGTPLQSPQKDSTILTLSEDGVSSSGTLLASTTYVWYGKITAQLKTSRGAGVVTAFILLGDNKDEIDFEFVGTDLTTAQSNYYFQGITDYRNSKNITVDNPDTFSGYHTYEIDWQPDSLTWSVDGTQQRQLNKKDTFNKTDNQYHYPQTPARVQLSLWPAGLAKNGQGTVDWAGGAISWSATDPSKNGYYYAMYKEVDIECYQPPSDVAYNTGNTSYVYTDKKQLENDVAITGNNTILKSLLGSGTDMDKDLPAKASGTSSGSSGPTDVATIPGLSGAGPGTDGTRGDNGGSGSGTNSGDSSTSTGVGGFTQNNDNKKGQSGGAGKVAGSMVAVVIACVGGMLLL